MAEQTVWELFSARAVSDPQAPMLIEAASGKCLTFGEAAAQAECLAGWLYEEGVRPGETITWQLPTRLQTVLLMLALARLGCVQNPVLHLYREREFGAVIARSLPAVIVVAPADEACDYPALAGRVLAEVDSNARLLVLPPEMPANGPSMLPPPPADADAVRWIYCTSGTTSTPKGVLHADSALIAGGAGLALGVQACATDVGSIAFPFAHIGGVTYVVMLCLAGMSAVLLDRFVPRQAVEIFRRYGVTIGGGSSAHYQAMLAEQRAHPSAEPVVPSLRLLAGGGAPKPPALYFDVKSAMGCPVVHAYGMTEAPLAVTNCAMDTDEELAHTDGRPVPGVTVRIVQADGGDASPDEEGEIRLRGSTVCRGYLDPDQTRAAFDEQGFFRTGDLGRMSVWGRLSVTGRLKDVIIRKGENISAKEIEDLLAEHPAIAAAAVIGLPDPERGERVCAVVELHDGATFDFVGMMGFLGERKLMRQKLPEQLEIVDRLPRNEALNKIIKYQLRERFAS